MGGSVTGVTFVAASPPGLFLYSNTLSLHPCCQDTDCFATPRPLSCLTLLKTRAQIHCFSFQVVLLGYFFIFFCHTYIEGAQRILKFEILVVLNI